MKRQITYQHIAGVKVAAKFSDDREFRYRLEISLQNPSRRTKTACVVMQNPSRAGEDFADKSVQFMEKVVFQKEFPEFAGVKRLIVVNQFAFVQTKDFRGLAHEIGSENDAAIALALSEADIIVLGWGSGNPFGERKDYVLGLVQKMKRKPLFKTRMHPSRGRYKDFIIGV